MKLKHLRIGTQLKLSIGSILVMVALLSIVAWFQTAILWQNTERLYKHPLQVRHALGELETDIMGMRMEFRNGLLASDDSARQVANQNSAVYKEDALKQFTILFERYLGPRTDIENAHNSFIRWAASIESNWGLIQKGKITSAISHLGNSGDLGVLGSLLLSQIETIDRFAKGKADEFYTNAFHQKDFLNVQLVFLAGVILLISYVIGYILSLWIREPLIELTSVTEHFQKGDLAVRSRHVSANEFGKLSAAFNQMAETISFRIETEKKTAAMADALIVANELREFGDTVIEKYMEITESTMGAFYIRNADDGLFSPLSSMGVNPEILKPFDSSTFEGEFGRALKTGNVSHIKHVPEDTLFTFKTFAGTAVPREIITLPLLVKKEVRAMISLASLKGYSMEILSSLSPSSVITLNTAFTNILATDETRRLASELKDKNMFLETQQEELVAQGHILRSQAEELQEQNVELEHQRLAVEESSRLKSQFLSNMSHELRTPLNSVMALSRVIMMQAKSKLSDEELSYLEIIERNGKHLLALINDILDLSKIEAGRMDVNPKPFSLAMVIENLMESMAPLANGKHIEIRKEIPEKFPLIESDEIRVTQILQNLLANAVKFTSVGHVIVSATCDEENISVTISDTGIGMAENDLGTIFDEFRQVDGSSSRRHEGTGLGLAIARKAVMMLGGNITVTSTPGKGSAFTVTLPIDWKNSISVYNHRMNGCDKGDPKCLVQAEEQGKAEKTPSHRILLVEDNESAIIQVRSVLSGAGYTVDVARGGQEAFEYVAHTIPDGIVLDLMMPGMDGFEVLEKIRGSVETARIPVLILTAKDLTPEDFRKLSANHVKQLVQKGDVDREGLLSKMSSLLETRPGKDSGGGL